MADLTPPPISDLIAELTRAAAEYDQDLLAANLFSEAAATIERLSQAEQGMRERCVVSQFQIRARHEC